MFDWKYGAFFIKSLLLQWAASNWNKQIQSKVKNLVFFLYQKFPILISAEGAEKDFNSKRDKLRKDFEDKLSQLDNEKKKIQMYKDQIDTLQNQVIEVFCLTNHRVNKKIKTTL